MARQLFISQDTISSWVDQDKVDFDGNVMTIKSDGRRFRLVEAVRFVGLECGDQDDKGLLGKVKTDMQLVDLGAERYRDSVIYQDVAYKVQEGFIAEIFLKEVEGAAAPPPHRPTPPPPPPLPRAEEPDARSLETARTQPSPGVPRIDPVPVPQLPPDVSPPAQEPAPARAQPGEEQVSDEELLTRFLLENL
ncbi:MAG: hypothetical protein JXR96_01145 [Deltaproteobacteria bacterium]|nr:hypothetical protein [Deltaproteobacteria bacterium]